MTAHRHADGVLLIASLLLLGFGLTMVMCASAGLTAEGVQDDLYFDRQLLRAGVGLLALAAAYVIPSSLLPRLALVAIVLSLTAVSLTLTPLGHGPAGQVSERWLRVAGFVFQPSEVLKLALVIHLARLLARRGPRTATARGVLAPILVVVGAAGLIAAQPNMGTAVVLAGIGFAVIFLGGARLRDMVVWVLPLVAVAILRVLSVPYERQRLLDWWNGEGPAAGWQVKQSLIALGSGGPLGVGFGESMQKFSFLPAPHTDFIFAIIGEEGGFVVGVLVLAIYALIVTRALRVSVHRPDAFGGLVAAGIGIMIGVQVLLNVAVVTGILPTTGLPLPFLSYGGSSLIVHLGAIGVLLRLSKGIQSATSVEVCSVEPGGTARCS